MRGNETSIKINRLKLCYKYVNRIFYNQYTVEVLTGKGD